MGLPDGQWAAVIFNDYALAFLRAEQDTGVAELIAANPSFGPTISQALADTADTANGDQNWLRLRVLNLLRCRYVGEIPPDTAWHRQPHG